MKKSTIISALALCFLPAMVGATEADNQCVQKTVTVCPKPKVKKRKKPVPVNPPCVTCPAPTVVVQASPPVVITKIKRVPVTVVLPCPRGDCQPEPSVVVGGRLALGLSLRDQYTMGLVGLRLESPGTHLGLDVFSQFDHGLGAQLLLYPYRGNVVKLHVLDPGFLITGDPFNYQNNRDVDRRVDLLLGAGVQVKLTCHLSFTTDVRIGLPKPVFEDCKECDQGWRLDRSNLVGNSFAATQLWFGLLLHN